MKILIMLGMIVLIIILGIIIYKMVRYINEKARENNEPKLLLFICFFVPIIGFLYYLTNIRKEKDKDKKFAQLTIKITFIAILCLIIISIFCVLSKILLVIKEEEEEIERIEYQEKLEKEYYDYMEAEDEMIDDLMKYIDENMKNSD